MSYHCSIQDLVLVRRKTYSFLMSAFLPRICVSFAFCPSSSKHTLIYSASMKGAENASAENKHNSLVDTIKCINMVLYKWKGAYLEEKKRTQVK